MLKMHSVVLTLVDNRTIARMYNSTQNNPSAVSRQGYILLYFHHEKVHWTQIKLFTEMMIYLYM